MPLSKLSVFLVASMVVAMLCTSVSRANNIVDTAVSAAEIENSGSTLINGVLTTDGDEGYPYVIQVFVDSNECVRLDMVSPPSSDANDLELVVVSSSGAVYRSDDRDGSIDRRPLVKIKTDGFGAGWYTVHVASFNGGPLNLPFLLRYGRYNKENLANCSNDTKQLEEPAF